MINLDQVVTEIERRGRDGLKLAADYAKVRAQEHAPVRKIFKGTTFRVGKTGFREPIPRRVSVEGEQRVGHANSLMPLLRRRDTAGKTQFISGDFRQIDPVTGRLRQIGTGRTETNRGSQAVGELAVFTRDKGGRIQKVDPAKLKPVSGEQIGKLTSRGRFEVRSGRANFQPSPVIERVGGKAIRASREPARVGGRLRDEIHVEGPFNEGRFIWMEVVSATKDPKTGRLYPRDQEFGTRHHPPHPFLRPALQESRGPLRRHVREAIRGGSRKPAGSRGGG